MILQFLTDKACQNYWENTQKWLIYSEYSFYIHCGLLQLSYFHIWDMSMSSPIQRRFKKDASYYHTTTYIIIKYDIYLCAVQK